MPQRVHHRQREAALAQVGDGGERARVEQRVNTTASAPGGSAGRGMRSRSGFTDRYNRTASPFSWKYTADDLKNLLRRISEYEEQDTKRQSGLAMAA